MSIRDVTIVDWSARCAEFEQRRDALTAADYDEWGQGLWFLGRDDACEQAWARAHEQYLAEGRTDDAVRCAFWLSFVLGHQHQQHKAAAWGARVVALSRTAGASALTATAASLCIAFGAYESGDLAGSIPLFRAAAQRADASDDSDLSIIATMGLGRSLAQTGRVREGFALLDRVMLLIGQGEASDRAAGPAFCAAIASLLARSDIERARVWTRELDQWCDAQVGLVPFRGECTLNHATILQLGGEWHSAAEAVQGVCENEPQDDTRGIAWYRLAELQRVRGDRTRAEAAYREAAALGCDVQPGLALWHRDAGEIAVARAGVARALAMPGPPGERAELLAAAVRLALDDRDNADAAEAADELTMIAGAFDTGYLRGLAAHAAGEVALAGDDGARALGLLRSAWIEWRRLDAPYHAALTRAALGRACRAVGDEEGAQLEFDAARTALAALGAVPDLARLERIAASGASDVASGASQASGASRASDEPAGLSPREREVIALIARGWSNRRIAEHLFLSERTVARHVSNILTKVMCDNRAGATAYAFQHGLATAS